MLILSATDLSNFLGCRHRTALDMAVADGTRKRPYFEDPLLDMLWQRGLEHEKRYVELLRAAHPNVVDLGEVHSDVRAEKTLEAMRAGADVIVQGELGDGRWIGKPDILQRVELPSDLGGWSYEIADTKLARETRAGTILQLCLYSDLLTTAQGRAPEHFHVVTPDPVSPIRTYRVDDYSAYYRLVRAQMLTAVARDHQQLALENYPEPVDHCEICYWQPDCLHKRRTDDHLSLVAGISRTQRRELESRAIKTLTTLAGLAVPIDFKPRRGSAETYERVRHQAKLQLDSRGKIPPLHELLSVEPEKGLCRLPEPTPGDLFLDLEGDPFAVEGGREYLFGLAKANGSYVAQWAFTEAEERTAFEWSMDLIADAIRQHPGMHVYHYAAYEQSAFKRLMGRHATRESELDTMLREGRFVDLYAVVKHGLRAGIEGYSIKNLEPLYTFDREIDLRDARVGRNEVELGLQLGIPDKLPAEIRDTVEGYNRDDCVSTLRLRDWLEWLRTQLVSSGTDVPRKLLEEGDAPTAVDERAKLVEALRGRLLNAIPESRLERTAEQQGRWLLAYMLDYHRRESKATWWEFFRLCDLEEEELLDEREAVAGAEFVERVDLVRNKRTKKPTGSVIDRYRYPAQEMEIDAGDEVILQDEEKFGDVVAVDRINRTIDVKKSASRLDVHPSAMFEFLHIRSDAMEGALLRIGESLVAGDARYGAARSLLAAHPPRLRSAAWSATSKGEEVSLAKRVCLDLDETVLAIQGPPGAGKTYCGSHMICELVKQGKRVGITATGHKVIRKLLEDVDKEARRAGVAARLAHRGGEDEVDGSPSRIAALDSNPAALAALTSGEANVVGGTAWLWAREEFASSVDVLFVDEAGQMALANVIAVSQAANSVVLLGDPQQLEQPRKGSHPDGVDVSALEHLLGGHQTLPPDRGIFLPETWRLAPGICEFTSELFYESRLTSHKGLERQRVTGVGAFPESGLAFIEVDHDGNRNFAQEEIDIVADLVAQLTMPGAKWRDVEGVERQITGADILVVAPYNAHVSRLYERLAGTGVRVGTVDKFQGQEAPVVIYSMATSRPEDAPRGMEFLYSLNRLNVATSRARCLAILVASSRLFEPECRSPRQMQLANALCRFREMALATT